MYPSAVVAGDASFLAPTKCGYVSISHFLLSYQWESRSATTVITTTLLGPMSTYGFLYI